MLHLLTYINRTPTQMWRHFWTFVYSGRTGDIRIFERGSIVSVCDVYNGYPSCHQVFIHHLWIPPLVIIN